MILLQGIVGSLAITLIAIYPITPNEIINLRNINPGNLYLESCTKIYNEILDNNFILINVF